jgi:hypothetical protein
VIRLEEYDYSGAMTVAVVMLVFSFALLVINLLERWTARFNPDQPGITRRFRTSRNRSRARRGRRS